MTQLENDILARWQRLREERVAPRERLNDPEIIRLERELQAIRDAIRRKS